jgi:hypothetical protein
MRQRCAATTRLGAQRGKGEIPSALHGGSTPEDRRARRNQTQHPRASLAL